ncbi:hypothetical protein CBM2609_B30124 [Cupriavidus taiwanensis]|nr:hypothetical protein CBM2604_B40122 [Cupriavidus taiwanensis]SOZ32432.1 hypothetical protein CBM2609_B30124 [Cupriavidus taiwanensis]SOZ48023.1 hypothetical protein CBM2610_B30122 [Cupriavidus taiwanensis]
MSSAAAEVRSVQPSVGATDAAIVLSFNQKKGPAPNETYLAVAFRPAMAGGRHPHPGIDACRLQRRWLVRRGRHPAAQCPGQRPRRGRQARAHRQTRNLRNALRPVIRAAFRPSDRPTPPTP